MSSVDRVDSMNSVNNEIHAFDSAITLSPVETQGRIDFWNASVSKDYQNMVGPFGGVTAAQVINSVLNHPEREGMPVSLTLNYLGAIGKGNLEIKPILVKTNRSNQHWKIELWQNGELHLNASAVFAKRKDTWSSQELEMPQAPKFDEVKSQEGLAGIAPWVRQYDFRFVQGSPFEPPKDGNTQPSESLVWLADKPSRALDFASLTALADAFFPRIIVRRRKMVPFGTVSMTINFHVTEAELASVESSELLGHARASNFNNGFFEQTAELWSPNGKLMVSSSQMVYYKD